MTSEAAGHAGRGRFIVLEGGEGAGKSTQAQRLGEWLRARGRAPLLTREPGGCPLAEAVRAVVLQDWSPAPDALTEALLMFAARREHLRTIIEPALAEGRDVICDRFVDASYAYQGAARGLAQDVIATLERMVLEGRRADLVLLLDIDPEKGVARVRSRGHANRFDAADLAVQRRIRAAYLERAAADPARYFVCDATAKLEHVSAVLRSRVATLLNIAE